MRRERFLGRTVFDPNTKTWMFSDGSGVICDEARIEMEIGTGNSSGRLPMFDNGTGRRNFFDIKKCYLLK